MGSASDEEAVQPTINTLESLGVSCEVRVMSAHRTPERVHEYASTARERGLEVLIAAAGGSAALGGALAAQTTLPVIGIPLTSSELNGWDALLSTAQMPPGIPGGRHGRGRLGRAQRRLLRRANPRHQARRHPRGRGAVSAIPTWLGLPK